MQHLQFLSNQGTILNTTMQSKTIVYIYLSFMVVYALAWSTYSWFLGVHLIKAGFTGFLISFPIIVGAVSYILIGPLAAKFIDPMSVRKSLQLRFWLVSIVLIIFLSNTLFEFNDTASIVLIFITYTVTHCLGVVSSLLVTKVPFILDEAGILPLGKIRTFHNLGMHGGQIIAPGIAMIMSDINWSKGVFVLALLQIAGILAAYIAPKYFGKLPFTYKPIISNINKQKHYSSDKKKQVSYLYIVAQLLLNMSFAAMGSLLMYITFKLKNHMFEGFNLVGVVNIGFITTMLLSHFNSFFQMWLQIQPIKKFCIFFISSSLLLVSLFFSEINIIHFSFVLFLFGTLHGVSILLLQSSVMNLIRGEALVKYNSFGMALAYIGTIISCYYVGCIVDSNSTANSSIAYLGLVGLLSGIGLFVFAIYKDIYDITAELGIKN